MYGPDVAGWLGNCEASLRNRQKIQKRQTFEEVKHWGYGQMHCEVENKLHQIDDGIRL
jgi:hypothetical protein